MEKKIDVEYPSREEIRREVNVIVSRGLPQQQGLWDVLREVWRSVGLKAAVGGTWGAAGAALMATVFLCFLPGLSVIQFQVDLSLVFGLSPLLYLSVYLLCSAREFVCGTYEVVMACKYNLRYLLALRMLFVSVCGLVLNIAVCGALCLKMDATYIFQLCSASLCSLFLCSLLFLWILRRPGRIITAGAITAAWFALVIALQVLLGESFKKFIGSIPAIVYLALGLCLLALTLIELKKFVTAKSWEGVQIHAHRG